MRGGDSGYEIWTMNGDGTDQRQITTGGGKYHPAWSPDGTKIAFEDGDGIHITNADGSGGRLFLETGINPSWSPDGTRIAFDDRSFPWPGFVEIAFVDGHAPPIGLLANGRDLVWSPSGARIAYVDAFGSSGNVHVANADATADTQLTFTENYKSRPSWSPDGTKIAFSENLPNNTGASVVVMNADGSGRTALGPGGSPVWSPDGTKLVYVSGGDGVPPGGGAIWTMNADGSNQTRITSGSTDYAPDWQMRKIDQTISFAALADRKVGDPDFPLVAAATSGLPVTFAATGSCTISGVTVQLTGAGSCAVTASQPGNATYNAAPDVSQSFLIVKRPPTPTCTVPKVVGKTLAKAKASIVHGDCRAGKIGYAYSRSVKKGLVVSQSRRPGSRLPVRSKVDLVVSRGRKR